MRTDCRGRQPQALVTLLQQTNGLRTLRIDADELRGGEAKRQLVEAIGEGKVGGELRCLELSKLDSALVLLLVDYLSNSRLPYLRTLELPCYTHLLENGLWGDAIAGMVEERERHRAESSIIRSRWPPLTDLYGIHACQPEILRRIWACCLPKEVELLAAAGSPQLAALGEYMKQQVDLRKGRTTFRALQVLCLAGDVNAHGEQ